jgi:hypothetical protein
LDGTISTFLKPYYEFEESLSLKRVMTKLCKTLREKPAKNEDDLLSRIALYKGNGLQ